MLKGVVEFFTITIFLVSISFVIAIIYYSNLPKSNNIKVVYEIDETVTYKLKVAMVGDALIHASVYKNAYRNGIYDFTKQLKFIKPYLEDYDLAYYNQETIFGGESFGYSSYPRFNTPSEFGDAMLEAGFNLVSLANNHTLDKGEKGILNAFDYWSKKNISYNGISDSDDTRDNIKIYSKNNISYAFLSYTTITNGLSVPDNKDYLVNIYSEENVKRDIDRIKDSVDIILVAMHWGSEYTHTPTKEQVDIANYLSSLNVDVVIGTHPHVIQPVEIVGDTLVFFSLGNFISGQIGISRLVGMVGSIEIIKTIKNEDISIEITNIGGELLYTYYNYSNKELFVIPFPSLTDQYLNNHQSIYEEYKKIANRNMIIINPN